MGVDIKIFIACDGDLPPLPEEIHGHRWESHLEDHGSLTPSGPWYDHAFPFGSTHELRSLTRYYGPGNERGPWPEIERYLRLLISHPSVERLWYTSDIHSEFTEMDADAINAISEYYRKHGDRPYRDPDYTAHLSDASVSHSEQPSLESLEEIKTTPVVVGHDYIISTLN